MKWVIGFAVWLALVLATALYVWLDDQSYVGSGYVAKEICSCVYVGSRDFAACRTDLMPLTGLGWLRAEPLPDGSGVRAWLPGFDPRIARAEDGGGCTLEP
jgi:hypothetical protein